MDEELERHHSHQQRGDRYGAHGHRFDAVDKPKQKIRLRILQGDRPENAYSFPPATATASCKEKKFNGLFKLCPESCSSSPEF